jgi:hypothetical protein
MLPGLPGWSSGDDASDIADGPPDPAGQAELAEPAMTLGRVDGVPVQLGPKGGGNKRGGAVPDSRLNQDERPVGRRLEERPVVVVGHALGFRLGRAPALAPSHAGGKK